MKVSYSNYPILELIEKGRIDNFYVFDSDRDWFDKNSEEYFKALILCIHDARQNINVVAIPFLEAVKNAYNKLDGLLVDILEDASQKFDVSGVYVLPKTVHIIDFHKDGINSYLTSFIFLKTGEPLSYAIGAETSDFNDGYGWKSKEFSFYNGEDVREGAAVEFHTICIIDMFKRYAEVEVKHLKAGQRVKDINCKYVNDTKMQLTYLDSKWFTTLVKSDGFKVRGHFRLQPYGHGMTEKKLIWIEDFMKTGYTAPARKIAAGLE